MSRAGSNVVSIDSWLPPGKTLEERDQLIEENLDLVTTAAMHLVATMPPNIAFDDLVSAGNEGLFRAANRFLPDHHAGATFRTYADPFIRGAMKELNRRRELREAMNGGLDEVVNEPVIQPVSDQLIDSGRLRRHLNEAFSRLPDRQREILQLFYIEELPMSEAARRAGIATSYAYLIHRQALGRLRAIFEDLASGEAA